jgi:hypothetical protein
MSAAMFRSAREKNTVKNLPALPGSTFKTRNIVRMKIIFTQCQRYHNTPPFSDIDVRGDQYLQPPAFTHLFLNFSMREKNFSLIAVFIAKPA